MLRKVAVFRHQFLPYSETFIHDELRCHERYAPTVLARRELDPTRFPGHRVVSIDSAREPRRLASLWYGLSGRSRRFDVALRQGGFALMHAHFGNNGAYALPFAKRHGLPLVVSMHGHDVTSLIGREKYHPGSWPYWARYQALFREAAMILPASGELHDLLIDLGCSEAKLRVHRLGVDLEALDGVRARAPAIPARVTMVGRFVEKKGHEYGFRAVATAVRRGHDLELTVIGDGPLRPRYEALVRELGLANVRFTGPLPHAAVLDEIAASRVLLAPSVIAKNLDRESGMIVAKEAAGLGVPVVGTRHGGLPEIIEHDVTGYLVAERDAEALGDRLCELLCDPERSARMGSAAREKMRREYDLRARVRALEALYDEVLERAPRSVGSS